MDKNHPAAASAPPGKSWHGWCSASALHKSELRETHLINLKATKLKGKKMAGL